MCGGATPPPQTLEALLASEPLRPTDSAATAQDDQLALAAHTSRGWTLLHFAARDGLSLACARLIARKASLEAMSADGWTPLLLAAQAGRCALTPSYGCRSDGLGFSGSPQLP
jgi:ankyrin repeat protein